MKPPPRIEVSIQELQAILEHARASLSDAEFATLQGAMQTLQLLTRELEKKGVSLSEKERSAKEKDYEQRLQEYQQFLTKAKEEIQTENAELTKRIAGDIFKVVQDYGRKKGYLFIFIKNDSMIYMDGKADLTDEILRALNASEKNGPAASGS